MLHDARDHLGTGRARTLLSRSALWSLAALATMAGPCPAAFAQAAPGASPLAQPLNGQVSANAALNPQNAGNAERTTIVPSIRTVYDTNVLRREQPAGVATDNFRVTPGLDLSLRRNFGRFAFNVGGSAGYDFNSRYRFLNRTRIDFSGGLRAPVGAVCTANLTASYAQYQFDQADLNQTVGATTHDQIYGLGVGCARPSGLSPVAGITYRSRTSSSRGLSNYTQLSERLGIAYARPGLGTVTLSGSASQLRRSNIEDVLGIRDDTDVQSIALSLNRAVSPRIQFNASVGYTKADPVRAGVAGFAGLSYDAGVTWRLTPRFVVTGGALRQVTNENGISATYVIRDDYQAAVSWQFGRASRLQLSGSHTLRDFRGEELTPGFIAIRDDRTEIVSLSYGYNFARRLRFGLAASERWRDSRNPIYDYQSTVFSGSIGARF